MLLFQSFDFRGGNAPHFVPFCMHEVGDVEYVVVKGFCVILRFNGLFVYYYLFSLYTASKVLTYKRKAAQIFPQNKTNKSLQKQKNWVGEMLLKKVVERINFVINEPELGFLCLHPFGWAVCLETANEMEVLDKVFGAVLFISLKKKMKKKNYCNI